MHRRDLFRSLFNRAARPQDAPEEVRDAEAYMPKTPAPAPAPDSWASNWQQLPDMPNAGAAFDRFGAQHWEIRNGALRYFCDPGDSLMLLRTHQVSGQKPALSANLIFQFKNLSADQGIPLIHTGLRFGIKRDDVLNRTLAGAGEGLHIGLSSEGYLFAGIEKGKRKIDVLKDKLRLSVKVISQQDETVFAKISLLDSAGQTIEIITTSHFQAKQWEGSVALFGQTDEADSPETAVVVFNSLDISGAGLIYSEAEG